MSADAKSLLQFSKLCSPLSDDIHNTTQETIKKELEYKNSTKRMSERYDYLRQMTRIRFSLGLRKHKTMMGLSDSSSS